MPKQSRRQHNILLFFSMPSNKSSTSRNRVFVLKTLGGIFVISHAYIFVISHVYTSSASSNEVGATELEQRHEVDAVGQNDDTHTEEHTATAHQ